MLVSIICKHNLIKFLSEQNYINFLIKFFASLIAIKIVKNYTPAQQILLFSITFKTYFFSLTLSFSLTYFYLNRKKILKNI